MIKNKRKKQVIEITDTHCHPNTIIGFEKHKNNVIISYESIIKRAQNNFVQKIFCIATERVDFNLLREIGNTYKEFYFSLGIHPCDAATHCPDDFSYLNEQIKLAQENNEKIIGIGEIGIDCFHDSSPENIKKQQEAFDYQLSLAALYSLPVIIHSRNATEYTLPLLKKYEGRVRGVIHAFGGDLEEAKKYLDLNFYLGIGGVLTYPKNVALRKVVCQVGPDSLLLETDAPFLPVQSMRGKVNYPEYCYLVGNEIANLVGKREEEVFKTIEENVQKLFFGSVKK